MFDWKDEGFAAPPIISKADGSEKLYRAWGGHPGRKWGNKERDGVCFSFDRAISRWDAERLYAVMEHQNPVLYLTEFSVPEDTPLWIGKVHPGRWQAVLGGYSGSQAFIERAHLSAVVEVGTETLRDDLGTHVVHTGPLPRVDQ